MKINKVRYCRVKADMTQLELSAKMGISNTHLNRIESGASPLSEKNGYQAIYCFRCRC